MPGRRKWHIPSHRDVREKSHTSGSWIKIRTIGQGVQGRASLVQHERTGEPAVRKVSVGYVTVDDEEAPLEAYILHSVLPSSPRITKLISYGYETCRCNDNDLVQFFEYCRGGDLKHAVRASSRIPEDFVWHCFIQIAEALNVTHNAGSETVVHADVKPDNIFLDQPLHRGPPWPNLKLGDFGVALLGSHGKEIMDPRWQGPELPHLSPKTDIWGLGAIIHWLCHDERDLVPMPPKSFKGSYHDWTLRPEARKPKSLPSRYSDPLNSAMMKCLEWDPRERISSRRLVERLERDRPRRRYR